MYSPCCRFYPRTTPISSRCGYTIRADFPGGEIFSDLRALLLSAVGRRIGLIDRLAAAITDLSHASYIKHTLRDLLTQRTFQIASAYDYGNDSNMLRRDPLFKPAAERAPLDNDNLLACSATFSRLDDALSSRDIYCMARALVLLFIAGYRCAPASITLDLGHTDDAASGQVPDRR